MNNYLNDYDELISSIKDKKLFIFDLDGTIANTERLHYLAYRDVMKELYNIDFAKKHMMGYIGKKETDIYKLIEEDYNINIDYDLFFKKRINRFIDLIDKLKLMPFEYFLYIKKKLSGKNVILVSSQDDSLIDLLFSKWHLDTFIPKEKRFSMLKMKTNKIDIYKNLKKYVGCDYDSDEVVVFEDSLAVINLANSLGYKTIGIEHEFNYGALSSLDDVIKQV